MPRHLVPDSASWIALVAATTLGAPEVGQVRAHVSGAVAGVEPLYRLVVQTYATGALDAEGRPSAKARPLGSVQRAVTADELARGLAVNVIQVGPSASNAMVVAWVEPGEPNLELGALTARPSAQAMVGVSPAAVGERAPARVVLGRRG